MINMYKEHMRSVLHPEQCSHRAATIAVDMAHMVSRYLNTLSHFISKHELYHLELTFLYVIIDLMSSTVNTDHEIVLDQCKKYFSQLRRSEMNRE